MLFKINQKNSFMEDKKPIMFSGIFLDDKSRKRLLNRVKLMIPDGWEIYADHITISHKIKHGNGEVPESVIPYLELSVGLIVDEYGINDRVFAVGVDTMGIETRNKKPHITIAVNKLEGASPKESNDLEDWKTFKRPLRISGKVKEIPFKI